ncbi:MAG TPA: HAD family hydrolase [Acidimicrobiales bacterium]|nr:HAD family hydrolase [Acidimicrobiales bacterium]
MALVVGLDGDDTLWHNERLFSMTEERFRSLVAPWAAGHDLGSSLLETERRNLRLFGYGVKSFTLSMIETAIEVTAGRVPVGVIAELIDAGKQMLDHPVELLDGVSDTVPSMAEKWELILITKGDLFHQESKLARSGLLEHFDHVEIVSEKEPSTYRRILESAGVDPADFVMVGDSMRSDIEAVLDVGARAIHIPGYREWVLEASDLGHPEDGRWWRLRSFSEVPELLTTLR